MVIYQPTISGSLIVTGSATVSGSMTVTALTGNRALVTDANDQLVSSATTDIELGHLSGVTSAVQTQIDSKGYTLTFTSAVGNLVSGTTYYIGNFARGNITTGGISRVYIPKTGVIKKAYIVHGSATAGSITSITVNIILNNNTDTLVGTNTANVTFRTYINNSLSTSVTEGEYIELKVTSVSATAPTSNVFAGTIYIE